MTEAIKGTSAASGEPLSDEQIDAIWNGLDVARIVWGEYGSKHSLLLRRAFARAILAAVTPGAPREPLPAETAQPMFASHVGRRKWEQLQGDGYRMQRIEFARSIDGMETRGTIDPWGKVLWERASTELVAAQGAPTPAQPELLRIVRLVASVQPAPGHGYDLDAMDRAIIAARDFLSAGIQPTPAKEKAKTCPDCGVLMEEPFFHFRLCAEHCTRSPSGVQGNEPKQQREKDHG